MTERTKNLIENTLVEYNQADEKGKAGMIAFIEQRLKENDNGISNIGLGYDSDFVSAAQYFLKIVKK